MAAALNGQPRTVKNGMLRTVVQQVQEFGGAQQQLRVPMEAAQSNAAVGT